jgi:hypothetical protein
MQGFLILYRAEKWGKCCNFAFGFGGFPPFRVVELDIFNHNGID